MNRVRTNGVVGVVVYLVLTLVLGGCYSRSARKRAVEEASVAAAAQSAQPAVVVRSATAAARPTTQPAAVARAVAPVGDKTPTVAAPAVPARKARSTSLRYGRPGFAVYEAPSGRLWVFREGSDDLGEFLDTGEPAKRVTRIGVGPDGTSLMSSDGATLDAYLAATVYACPGFIVEMLDGRLWVFKEGSEALAAYRDVGEPAKRLTRIAAGPHDLTLIGPDAETLDAYAAVAVYGLPGFSTFLIEGRLWIFRDPSLELDDFRKVGEPAKRVTRIASGPRDLTLVGPDGETLDAYMAAFGG